MLNKGVDASENHLGWEVGSLRPVTPGPPGTVSGQAEQTIAGGCGWTDGNGNGINDANADCQADENNDL